MDKKWAEKDDTINKTYNEMKEKNTQFSERFPELKSFCEVVSPSYKTETEEDKSSEAKNNGSEQPADTDKESDKKD
jgi:hypothetical protein